MKDLTKNERNRLYSLNNTRNYLIGCLEAIVVDSDDAMTQNVLVGRLLKFSPALQETNNSVRSWVNSRKYDERTVEIRKSRIIFFAPKGYAHKVFGDVLPEGISFDVMDDLFKSARLVFDEGEKEKKKALLESLIESSKLLYEKMRKGLDKYSEKRKGDVV